MKVFYGLDFELVEGFTKFHNENPAIYELFSKYAHEAKNSGRKRFSHWMIINRIRWYSAIETTGKDYKISNNHIALYVRLFLAYHPEFDGFFLIKKMGNEE